MDPDGKFSKAMPYIVAVVAVAIAVNGFFLWDLGKDTREALEITDQHIRIVSSNLENTSASLSKKINEEAAMRQLDIDKVSKEAEDNFGTLQKLVDELERSTNANLQEIQDDLETIAVSTADFSLIIDDVLPGVVSVLTNVGGGSGAIVDSEGYIVTNYHVVDTASTISVVTNDGKSHPATLVGFHAGHDIAVLKIDGSFSNLEFARLSSVNVGEAVIAVGNPSGLGFTVTEGIVSAKRLASNEIVYIQTDVPINPGNSGGPLIDKEGKIIGLNNFKIAGTEGLGFAINSDIVEDDYNDIVAAAGG